MTNYTKTTDFAAKDSLPSGDSGKIIRGTEFETEFDNIATAVNSKSDANNPTFTGTVTIDGLTVNGNTVLGNAATDTVTVTADIASNLLPSADDTYNLGAVGAEWNDLFIDGVANIDSLVANTADINGGTVDGVTIGGSSAGAITGTTITGTSFVTSGNMSFGDGDRAVFGAGSDLQVFHDGSNSYIADNGTGDLFISGAANITFRKSGTSEVMAQFSQDGAASLYYDNAAKLATSSTGIDVTGTVTADGLTVEGDAKINDTDATPLVIQRNGGTDANTSIHYEQSTYNTYVGTGNSGAFVVGGDVDLGSSRRFAIEQNNDISFYEDTGTTAKLFWDASAESLMLNASTRAGTEILTVNGTVTTGGGTASAPALAFRADSNTGMFRPASQSLGFSTNGSEAMRIDSAGQVGIGTSSPASALDIRSANTAVQSRGNLYVTTNSTAAINEGAQISLGGTYTGTNETFFGAIAARKENATVGDFNAYLQFSVRNTGNLSEKMRIDSAGNVGIGTGSTVYADLQVHKTSGAKLWITADGNNPSDAGSLRFSELKDGNNYFEFLHDGSNNILKLTSNNGDIATFDRLNQRVGIGTDSPATKLMLEHNNDGAVGGTIRIKDRDSQQVANQLTGAIEFESEDATTPTSGVSTAIKAFAASSTGGSYLTISTTDIGTSTLDEAMRIDSSQNLLVGKTSADFGATAGVELRPDGRIATGRAGESAVFNRLSTDGEIALFRKDGSTVGSIGTVGGDAYFEHGGTGIRLWDGNLAITPCGTSGATLDGTRNLGASSARFKDLYLSGGAYLGGIAAANKLDDYEEGTWTGAVADAESGGNESSTGVSGTYVKIGKIVYLQFNVSNINTTGMTAGNDVHITGLPFTSANLGGSAKYTGTAHMSVVTFEQIPLINLSESSTVLKVIEVRSGAGVDSVVVSQLSSGASDIHGNLVYQTT